MIVFDPSRLEGVLVSQTVASQILGRCRQTVAKMARRGEITDYRQPPGQPRHDLAECIRLASTLEPTHASG